MHYTDSETPTDPSPPIVPGNLPGKGVSVNMLNSLDTQSVSVCTSGWICVYMHADELYIFIIHLSIILIYYLLHIICVVYLLYMTVDMCHLPKFYPPCIRQCGHSTLYVWMAVVVPFFLGLTIYKILNSEEICIAFTLCT